MQHLNYMNASVFTDQTRRADGTDDAYSSDGTRRSDDACSVDERQPSPQPRRKPPKTTATVKLHDGQQQIFRKADGFFHCPYPRCNYRKKNSPTVQVCGFYSIP